MKTLSGFTNQYQLQKTLRFELKPIGKTLENIEKKGLINNDEIRAESYIEVKKVIDEYHKYFIDLTLENLKLNNLEGFKVLYFNQSKTEEEIKSLNELQANLRKQIAQSFSKNPNDEIKIRYKSLFAKELIKLDLLNWESLDADKVGFVKEFEKFTTYFTGFHENRKNMYSEEDKSTAIAFRLIHENLPKFLDNIKIYEKIKKEHPDLNFKDLETELEEVLQGTTIDELFTLEFYNQTLTQTGIDFYNIILGGKSEEKQKKIKGLKEYVNLYRQKNNLHKKQLPDFTILYKQILSDRSSISFLPETFETDIEVIETLQQFYLTKVIDWQVDNKSHNLLQEITNILNQLKEFDLTGIYIRNDRSITDISNHIFGQFSIIRDALKSYYSSTINPLQTNARVTKKYDEEKEKYLTKTPYFSVKDIEEALWLYKNENEEAKGIITKNTVCDYFARMGKKKIKIEDENIDLLEKINTAYKNAESLLNTDYPLNNNLSQDIESKERIKFLLDSIKALLFFLKPLHIGTTAENKDVAFYSYYSALFDQLNLVTPLYDKTRNYLTKKPYSTEKIKLNFENSTLLNGWDVNKETDNTSILLRKDGFYYLAIMDKSSNKVFKKTFNKTDEECYEKMNYKLLPGANKMLPKVFFSKSRIDEFAPSDQIIENYEVGSHKKGSNFDIKHCRSLIDFFKSSINRHPDWKNFNFDFSETSTYDDLSYFYREVEKQGYQINFANIPETYINQLVEEGKIYLFQIYNKDFSPYSKGTPNMHTIYWKMLFDKENLKDVVYKLNGQAEIFFRKKSLNTKDTVVHKANKAIKNKNESNNKTTSTFDYDIVKDRRFTLDKFQFHVPITLNFKAEGNNNLNAKTNNFLKNNSDVHIIGIDRGERHLLYVSVINQKGEIIEQFSLNQIVNEYKGQSYKADYHSLLAKKEEERKQARVNWGAIENIKELKEGYLSQVVHKIARLMVKYNAIVVMEDLNFGFKRGRQKVEKQVYQKFEKMLIDKLNYLVFKEEDAINPGGKLKALQLTNKFDSFKKLGKQCGFIYYVPAALTSKIDPSTGFVNFFYNKYENREKARNFFAQFDSIRFNREKEYFEFEFDYNNFTTRAEDTITKWTVCTTNVPRYKWNRSLNQNRGGYDEINVSKELRDLFEQAELAYANGESLIEQITIQDDADFFKKLMFLFSSTVSLRHNNGEKDEKEEDYILSPVGNFFNSAKADKELPCDADANGAYHIALKGLWVKHKVNEADDISKIKLAISNKEWLKFVQERPFEK